MPLAPPQGRIAQPGHFAPQGAAKMPWPPQGDPGNWSPLSLGSSLAAWYKADAGCYTDAACLFASASVQSLSRASSSDLQLGDIDFTYAFWVKSTDLLSPGGLIGKGDITASGGEIEISFAGTTGVARVAVRKADDSGFVEITGADAIADGAWSFVEMYHDKTNNVIGVKVDNGSAVEAAVPAGVFVGTNSLQVGHNTNFGYSNAAIARVGFWKRLLTAGERTSLYNSGAGKFYADLTTAEKVSLVEYWNLCESSSTRVGSHAGLNLTPTNGPTVAAGPGEGACVDNSPIKRWQDQWTGALHATASDITKQPLYKTGIQNSLPGALFDGTLSYLNAAVSLSQPISVFIVAKVLTAGGSSVRVFQSGNFNPIFARHSTNKWSIYASSELTGSAASDASAHAFAMTFNGASSLLDVDGVSDITGDAGAGGMTSVNFSGTVGGGDIPANCYIHEIFFVSAASSAAVRSQATAYLRARWGV